MVEQGRRKQGRTDIESRRIWYKTPCGIQCCDIPPDARRGHQRRAMRRRSGSFPYVEMRVMVSEEAGERLEERGEGMGFGEPRGENEAALQTDQLPYVRAVRAAPARIYCHSRAVKMVPDDLAEVRGVMAEEMGQVSQGAPVEDVHEGLEVVRELVRCVDAGVLETRGDERPGALLSLSRVSHCPSSANRPEDLTHRVFGVIARSASSSFVLARSQSARSPLDVFGSGGPSGFASRMRMLSVLTSL